MKHAIKHIHFIATYALPMKRTAAQAGSSA